MKIFIDTGAFIAIAVENDKHHRAAKEFYYQIKNSGGKFITTNFVICETINYLRIKISHHVAVFFRENIYKSSIMEVVALSFSMEDAAFQIFKKYNDKDFSFTDCTSFSVMKSKKLSRAFAFDRHFEQYGKLIRLP